MNRILCLLTIIALNAVLTTSVIASGEHGHGHDDHAEHEAESAKGPHGGRLLEQDDFALEITIFEAGVPPEFRVYAYNDCSGQVNLYTFINFYAASSAEAGLR